MLIRDVLALEDLQAAGVRVVAGEQHLGREVLWVHTGEIPDIAKYLSGGEVLLTAGTGLGSASVERRRYVRELASVGVAAVIVELGRSLREIPNEMIEEAERHGLVLVELEQEVPFIRVTRAVHTSLVNRAYEALARATEIEEALTQLILDGASLDAVMAFLADQLGNPALLEDAGRRVVAYGRAAGPIGPTLRSWREHSRDRAHQDPSVAARIAETNPRCIWTSVALKGEIWGRLHVLEADRPFDDLARLTVSRAAATIALHLMSERGTHVSEAAEQMLVADVVQPNGRVDPREFLDKATGLGVDLQGELVVLSMNSGERGAKFREEPDNSEILQLLRQGMRAAKWPAVVGMVDYHAVAVAKAHPNVELRDLAARLLRVFPAGTHIGLSKRTRPALLPQAFSEARAAAQLGPGASEGFIHFYDDLALYRLLAPLAPGPELGHFVESELGPLIAHDQEHASELVRTLDAYLQANGSKTTAAQILHLQRRSIYYRIEKIERLLGRSIDSPTHRARLFVALRANELLESRSRHPRTDS